MQPKFIMQQGIKKVTAKSYLQVGVWGVWNLCPICTDIVFWLLLFSGRSLSVVWKLSSLDRTLRNRCTTLNKIIRQFVASGKTPGQSTAWAQEFCAGPTQRGPSSRITDHNNWHTENTTGILNMTLPLATIADSALATRNSAWAIGFLYPKSLLEKECLDRNEQVIFPKVMRSHDLLANFQQHNTSESKRMKGMKHSCKMYRKHLYEMSS
jgi:hypothetical protein